MTTAEPRHSVVDSQNLHSMIDVARVKEQMREMVPSVKGSSRKREMLFRSQKCNHFQRPWSSDFSDENTYKKPPTIINTFLEGHL
jgi:hypothetical protein